MSGSNRGFYIVATVGAIFAAVTFGSAESRCQREQVAYGHQTAKTPSEEPHYQFGAERSWLPCLVERAVANPPSVDGTDKEQRDLIAQESAALWGFWITVAAFLQVLLSAFGLWALLRTFRQGQAALDHARLVSASELRPWVDFDIKVSKIDRREEGVDATLVATLKNTGKSAALRVRAECKLFSISENDHSSIWEFFRTPLSFEGEFWERTLLPGGIGVTVLGNFLPDDQRVIEGEEGDEYFFLVAAVSVAYCWGSNKNGMTGRSFVIGPVDEWGDVSSIAIDTNYPIEGKLHFLDRGYSHAT